MRRFLALMVAAGLSAAALAPASARAQECGPGIDGEGAVMLAEELVRDMFEAVDLGVLDQFAGRFGPETSAWMAEQGPPAEWLTLGIVGTNRLDFAYQHIDGHMSVAERARVRVRWRTADERTIARTFRLTCRDARWRVEGLWLEPEGRGQRPPS